MKKNKALSRGLSLIEVSVVLVVSALIMASLSYFFLQKKNIEISKDVVSQYNTLKSAVSVYISNHMMNDDYVVGRAIKISIDDLKKKEYLPSSFSQRDNLSQSMSVWVVPQDRYIESYIVLSGGREIDSAFLKKTAMLIGYQGGVVYGNGNVSVGDGWWVSSVSKLNSIGIKVEINKNILFIRKRKENVPSDNLKLSFKDEAFSKGKSQFSNLYSLGGSTQTRTNTWNPAFTSDGIKLTWSAEDVGHYNLSLSVDSTTLLSDHYFDGKNNEFVFYPAADWVGKTVRITFSAYDKNGSTIVLLRRNYTVSSPNINFSAIANIVSLPVNQHGGIESVCTEQLTPIVSVLNSLIIKESGFLSERELLNPIVFNLIRKDALGRKDLMFSGVMKSNIYTSEKFKPQFGYSPEGKWLKDMAVRSSVNQDCSSYSLFEINWKYLNKISSPPSVMRVNIIND